ncbi:hypothetical protein TIFTF001_002417 [Ficus carica]|uniref:Uncharacterized protein n=1 Tax=Ficus carica TaxID=3494 RepID=A0AA87Z3R1_FICCA|nr:hypothetical protein TIFTF001_002417 [Ficus carica]
MSLQQKRYKSRLNPQKAAIGLKTLNEVEISHFHGDGDRRQVGGRPEVASHHAVAIERIQIDQNGYEHMLNGNCGRHLDA